MLIKKIKSIYVLYILNKFLSQYLPIVCLKTFVFVNIREYFIQHELVKLCKYISYSKNCMYQSSVFAIKYYF